MDILLNREYTNCKSASPISKITPLHACVCFLYMSVGFRVSGIHQKGRGEINAPLPEVTKVKLKGNKPETLFPSGSILSGYARTGSRHF